MPHQRIIMANDTNLYGAVYEAEFFKRIIKELQNSRKGHLEEDFSLNIEKPKAEKLADASVCVLQFETGSLSNEEIEAIFNTLPFEITFVDKNDCIKYFNKTEKRRFTTKATLGEKVQLCHPAKSIYIVNKILEAFRKGEKNMAELWIQVRGRLVHTRFFAVRNKNGEYFGTMQVSQDVTDLSITEREKNARFFNWIPHFPELR